MTVQQQIDLAVTASNIVATVVGVIIGIFAIMIWDKLGDIKRRTDLTYMIIDQIEKEYWEIKNKHKDCIGCKHIYYDSGGGVHCDIEPEDKICMGNYRSRWEADNFAEVLIKQ